MGDEAYIKLYPYIRRRYPQHTTVTLRDNTSSDNKQGEEGGEEREYRLPSSGVPRRAAPGSAFRCAVRMIHLRYPDSLSNTAITVECMGSRHCLRPASLCVASPFLRPPHYTLYRTTSNASCCSFIIIGLHDQDRLDCVEHCFFTVVVQ